MSTKRDLDGHFVSAIIVTVRWARWGLSQSLLHQLAQAALIDRLLFDLVGNFQVAVLDGVEHGNS